MVGMDTRRLWVWGKWRPEVYKVESYPLSTFYLPEAYPVHLESHKIELAVHKSTRLNCLRLIPY